MAAKMLISTTVDSTRATVILIDYTKSWNPIMGTIHGCFLMSSGIELEPMRVYATRSKFLLDEVTMRKLAETNRRRTQSSRLASSKRPRWTREEISTLKRLYRTRSNSEIARVLRRTVSSIVFKGYRLGLSKGIRRLKEMGRENISKRWHKPEGKRSVRKSLGKKSR
jgi:hypothetical protein